MGKVFSSLAIRNYRIYFIGVLFTNIGQWMARTAQSWLVLTELTNNSASALGTLTALMFLPQLVLVPVAGRVADRFPKRRTLLICQIVGGIDALTLGLLVLTGHVELWMVYLIAVIDGTAVTFDGPSRQAFVGEMVPLSQLPNAIGLNSASFNAARLFGPGIAGVLIAVLGTGPVILWNVLSFISTAVALLLMNAEELHPRSASPESGGFIDGVKYAMHRPDLIVLFICGLALGGLGFNFQISNAVMVTVAFGKGAGEYGILGSLMGLGALAAALSAAARSTPRLRYVLIGMAGYTVFSLAAALALNYWVFAALQAPIGLFAITVLVSGNTLLQTHTSPEMRGRMMALWNLVISGVAPISSPVVGRLGDVFGPRATVMFGVIVVGVTVIGVTAAIMHNDQLRIRIDSHRRLPWLRLERGTLTQDLPMNLR
jgi:MFS family permease